MKLIVEAQQLPVGTLVTKPTGEKAYRVQRSVKIYDSTTKTGKELFADSGTIFLVQEDVSTNVVGSAINGSDLVAVTGTAQELIKLLQDIKGI